ncbi:DUF927 domain-containing protein [Flavobacterium sp.]|uniref:DUF927 domain-containing protein n=1 Tax=Flavobacterium sp. TaxID=239 RepID=UPI0032679A81
MPALIEMKPELDEEPHGNSPSKKPSSRRVKGRKVTKAVAATGKTEKGKPRKPASELPHQITAVYQAVDAHGKHIEKIVIEVTDDDGGVSFHMLDQPALILGQLTDLAKLVFKARLPYMRSSGLRELAAILLAAVEKEMYVAEHDGYHCLQIDGKPYKFYVWRDQVHAIGASAPLAVQVLSSGNPLPPASCTLDVWHEKIGRHMVINLYMLVALCAGISALLVQAFNLPRLILIFVGASSNGKSTTQQALQTCVEQATEIDMVSGTEKGLLGFLRQFRDRLVCMEELRNADDVAGVARMMFDVVNGSRRKTSSADQNVILSSSLSCGLILSNEETLAEIFARNRVTMNEGIAARVLELHCQGPHGMFHHLPGNMDASDFSNMLKAASARYYGAFWDEWVSAVAANADKIETFIDSKLPELQAELCEGMDIQDPVTRRMVRGMAGWACAGITAANLKLLPVKRSAIITAMRLVLKEHLDRQKHNTTPVGEKIISTVRDEIDRNKGKFPPFSQINANDHVGIYGYRHTTQEETLYLFFPAQLEKLFGEKFGSAAVIRTLRDAGYLSADSEGDQRQFRVPGRGEKSSLRKRFYAIKSSICFDVE